MARMGHQHRRTDRMVNRREHSKKEEPDAEHRRRVRRRQSQTGDSTPAEEEPQQIAPSQAICEPTHRQREQSKRDEGAGREANQAGIRQLPFCCDRYHGCRVDQEDEVVERVRDIDEGNRAARERVSTSSTSSSIAINNDCSTARAAYCDLRPSLSLI